MPVETYGIFHIVHLSDLPESFAFQEFFRGFWKMKDDSNMDLAPLNKIEHHAQLVDFRNKWCEGVNFNGGPSMISEYPRDADKSDSLFERVCPSHNIHIYR